MIGLPPSFRVHPRHYADRLPRLHARRCTLSVRLSEPMKDAVAYLAARRRMSMCEYVARLLNDHVGAAWKATC